MRISDWSSDVCSSDLYEDSRTLFPQLYFYLYQPGAFLTANATSTFQIIDETPAAFAQAPYDFSAIGLKGLRFTAGARYTWESVKLKQLDGSDTLSSEEHTSVLQSLMRISYAVF